MANPYTITLINNNATGNYVFFQTQPTMSQSVGPIKDVFTNVWISEGCAQGGSIVINTTRDFYAWSGKIKKPAAEGTLVTGGKALLATLGTKITKGNTFNTTHTKGIVDIQPTTASAAPSTFEIDTDTTITAGDNVLVGMAKPNPDGLGSFQPSALINATGNMQITILPKNDYWVVKADFQVGEIFNYTAVSKSAGEIAFEKNPGKNKATVTNNPDGTWSITYA